VALDLPAAGLRQAVISPDNPSGAERTTPLKQFKQMQTLMKHFVSMAKGG